MNKIHKNRLVYIIVAIIASGTALALILYALQQNLNFFFTPEQVINGEAPKNTIIRVGGMIQANSIARGEKLKISFRLSDYKEEVTVHYDGLLPDLFREGQGLVAIGKLNEKHEFNATQILAKHDENYMPPEVRDMLASK